MLIKFYIKRPKNKMSRFNKETKTINHDTLLYCCIQNNLFPVENPVQRNSWQIHKYYNSHVKTYKKWTPVTPTIPSSKSDLHDKCNKLLYTSQLLHAVYILAYDWTVHPSSRLYYVIQHQQWDQKDLLLVFNSGNIPFFIYSKNTCFLGSDDKYTTNIAESEELEGGFMFSG